MTTGYGISGIGYNPMMMGIGDVGLGVNSAYGNYDNYMLGMNGFGYSSGYNPMSMTGSIYGYGGYNPLFMGQMMSAMERNQLEHAGNMHSLVLQNETQAYRDTDKALIDKILTNSSVQKGIENLRTKVVEGDQDGICQEFDKLRQQIYKTYGDEIRARGHEENPYEAATQIINNLYTQQVTAQNGGVTADLKLDIIKYGEKAFTNGFNQGRRKGHHDRYVDETLQHCLGLRVDEKESKDKAQAIGKIAGKGCKVAEYGAIGAIAGGATVATTYGIGSKMLNKFDWKTLGKCGKWGAAIAGTATAVGCLLGLDDLIWKTV